MTTFELKFDRNQFQKHITVSREILHKNLNEKIRTYWKGFFVVLTLSFCIIVIPQAVVIMLSWLSIIVYLLYMVSQYLESWKKQKELKKQWEEWITENELVKKHLFEFDDEAIYYYKDDEVTTIKWKDVVHAVHTNEFLIIGYEAKSITHNITIPLIALSNEIGSLLSKTTKLNTRYNVVQD